jgi:polyprenyldihydroxybenzoate methyltransferase / 3-demethylubiquinol 3-O-methyltransferase
MRPFRRKLLSDATLCQTFQIPRSVTHRYQTTPASSFSSSPLDSSSSSSILSASSANPTEVSHFTALASTWWDPGGSSRLLHLMNPLRHNFIRSCHAAQPDAFPPGSKLRYLDVGCGGGIFAESAARLASTASVTGLDPSPAVLDVAREHARRDPMLHPELNPGRLSYVNGTIEDLAAQRADAEEGGEAQQYDVVSVFEVIEHVDAPAPFLDRCGKLVKPGGWLVLSTIARTWVSWFTTKAMAEDVLRIVPRGTHAWDKYINEDELRDHFQQRPGWRSPRSMGVVFVPGLGWKEVPGSERLGNYFFGVRKEPVQ